MQIGYLADHQEFIPTLARWHHEEWAYLRPGDSFETRVERLRAACGHREIPTVVIAFADSMLLGSPGFSLRPITGGRASVSSWCGELSGMQAPLACVGFTFTLLAWSSFILGTAGRLSNAPTTAEQMSW